MWRKLKNNQSPWRFFNDCRRSALFNVSITAISSSWLQYRITKWPSGGYRQNGVWYLAAALGWPESLKTATKRRIAKIKRRNQRNREEEETGVSKLGGENLGDGEIRSWSGEALQCWLIVAKWLGSGSKTLAKMAKWRLKSSMKIDIIIKWRLGKLVMWRIEAIKRHQP